MQLFYEPLFADDNAILNQDESAHAVKVLRKKEGDNLFVTNGKGWLFECQLLDANPKKCKLLVKDKKKSPSPEGYLHLAIAPTKNNDRMEWLVEKCTEIGLQEISFVYCSNSERYKFKTERIIKKAINAMKQSLSTYLPIVNNPVYFDDFIQTAKEKNRYIAHYQPENPQFYQCIKYPENCLILVGPEGDFTREELAQAHQNQYQAVNLGNKRLRTETAGLVACHTQALAHQ